MLSPPPRQSNVAIPAASSGVDSAAVMADAFLNSLGMGAAEMSVAGVHQQQPSSGMCNKLTIASLQKCFSPHFDQVDIN